MMDWSDCLYFLVITAIGILCYVCLFRFFAEKRKGRTKLDTTVSVITAVLIIWGDKFLFLERLSVRVVIGLVVTAFLMYRLYQISYLKATALCMLCDGASLIANYMSAVLLSKRYVLFGTQEVNWTDYFIVGGTLVLCRIVCWSVLLCLSRIIRNRIADILTVREWCALFLLSLITIFAVVLILQEIHHTYETEHLLYYRGIIAGMLLVNFIVYYLIGSIVKRELKLREYAVFREKVRNETAMYHSISENLEKQRKRTHEYKNQLAAVSALAAEGAYQELRDYIEKIETTLQHRMDAVDTNHVIVNAILNTKYREAVSKGIVFVLKVNDLSGLKMEEEDLVIILSNLLNNALEACERCEEKRIKLKFVLENGQVVISVKNSMAAMPVVESGKVLTSKTKDVQEHGMGIQNVVETVEKYDGRYMVDYGEGEFQFSILIPNEEKHI